MAGYGLYWLVNKARAIFGSDVDWEVKYNDLFEGWRIPEKMEEEGYVFDWYDPDTTYEEDVRAFMNALEEFAKDKLSDTTNGKGPYFVFSYDSYYPSGGMNDFAGTAFTLEAARALQTGQYYDIVIFDEATKQLSLF